VAWAEGLACRYDFWGTPVRPRIRRRALHTFPRPPSGGLPFSQSKQNSSRVRGRLFVRWRRRLMHRLPYGRTLKTSELDERRPPIYACDSAQSDFILDVLRDVLPTTGAILEIASGSGEHAVHFARNIPSLVFQPSDPDPAARLSVAAWVKATSVTNVHAPIAMDALHSVWPIASADGIICINMIHISPWQGR
jgi:tRNA G46 methylase TrmB